MDTNDDEVFNFRVSFIDLEGAVIESISVRAESLSIATIRATEIAEQLSAVDFFITAPQNIAETHGTSASASIAKLFGSLRRPWSPNVDPQTRSAGVSH